MKPTKETTIAINTIATLVVAASVLMAATFILFYYLDSSTGIKDAWSTIAGFFGGFATLTAAYIASILFNRWEDQHNIQVNSEFIMKFYDNLFDMKANAINIIGYLSDYLSLNTYEKRAQQHENLINHNKQLCYLMDYSIQKLSDLAFILDEDDYNKNFKPKIEDLNEKLNVLHGFYMIYIEKEETKTPSYACQILLDQLPELKADLYNHYRSFMVELKRYYRA